MKIYTIITNLIKSYLIEIQLILKPVKLMDIDDLITENRFDLNLRIKFLEEVINKKKKINETRYYKFIETPDGDGIEDDPIFFSKEFINLYQSIKKNGFRGYFIVAETDRFNHMEIVFKNFRKISNKKIKFKYQLIGGAHRFAVCKFLGYKKIPVKIVKSPFLSFPDFTDFIRRYKI